MKRMMTLLLALALCLCVTVPAFAEDGKVTYNGDSGEFIFEPGSEHSPTDLFPDFKDVMPGDVLTQKITIKNKVNKKIKAKIYLRSLGAQPDSVEFLSQLGLKVKLSDDNEMGYMFDAAANETAQLTDWVCLGTLYSGGEVNLDVILTVPVELDNEFQNRVGWLDWEFKVEEYMISPDDPEPPGTGDDTKLELWVVMMAGSLVLLLFILFLLWRKRDKEENAE